MPLTLRFQSSGAVPGDGGPIEMIGPSLTIGRGPENDVVLPDPDRLISKNHCVIEDQGGNAIVIDFSTNGTFLNYSKVALGRVPTPLNDGDVLSMGAYELVVNIARDRARNPMSMIAPPVDEGPVSHGRADRSPDLMSLLDDPSTKGDFLDDLLGGQSRPTGPSQVKRGNDFEDLLLPPLGDEEDPILGPVPGRNDKIQGASDPSHSPSFQDSFRPASRAKAVIPDDWDEDFLAPSKPVRAEAFAPRPDLPPDAFDDLLAQPVPEVVVLPPQQPPVPDDIDDLLGEASPFDEPIDAPPVLPVPEIEPPAPVVVVLPPVEPKPTLQPMPPPAPAAPVETAARAFLAEIGAADLTISDADLPATMTRMGAVLRLMIEGMREILMTRTSIKSEFRINQTMIGAGRNNPLKFSISPEQAVETMVKPTTKGYLDAQTATAEALRDIKAHEVAMVTGMEAALKGVLARLDPRKLEEKLDTRGGISSLLSNKKARYWDIYEKLYAEISDQAENDFHDLFSKEFARAYQEQLERLK